MTQFWGCYRCKRSMPMGAPGRTTAGGYFVCENKRECEKACQERIEKSKKVHLVAPADFKRARGATVIHGVCGVRARSITLDNTHITCKRCLITLRTGT